MSDKDLTPLSDDELAAESGSALPDKEVISLLDLNADLDLALDVAAPIDLAIAANANVAAPINAAVSANVLSIGSAAGGLAHQDVDIAQGLHGSAVANAPQDSSIEQGTGTPTDATGTAPSGTGAGVTAPDPTSALDGDLLNVDVNAAVDANLAAPIAGAVAANANVAAPIDASVGANIASVGSEATAIADQTGSISQNMDATAEATADQESDIQQ
jgi:hypothetical protein